MSLCWVACLLAVAPQVPEEPAMVDLPHVVASTPWAAGLGNHRAIVRVDAPSKAVAVTLTWRRLDSAPEKKDVVVVDLKSGERVKNVRRVRIEQDSGEIVFEARTAGEYAVYYLPYPFQNWWGGYSGDYTPTQDTADPAWTAAPAGKAEVIRFEDRTAFDALDPMLIPATAAEWKAFVEVHPGDCLVFTEDRSRPIQMTDRIPTVWLTRGPSTEFAGKAKCNEYYAFQIGLFAARRRLDDVRVTFTDLKSGDAVIPAKEIQCVNLGGVDTDGRPFVKRVDVPQGRVQALWCGVDVPRDAVPGTYSGTAAIAADGQPPIAVRLRIEVEKGVIEDRGDSEPWRHSRLRWLNSTIGIDDEVVAPYTPLKVKGRTVGCLGRTVRFDQLGMPESVKAGRNEVLSGPVRLECEAFNGFELKPAKVTFAKAGRVVLESATETADFRTRTETTMEFDGHVGVKTTVEAKKDFSLPDVRLVLPIGRESSQFFMGIGLPGGYTPGKHDWKWTGPQDSFWIGSVHAGLHCELRGATYNGPMLNLYHPAPPASWGNEGKGGCRVERRTDGATITAYTGPRTLKAGESVTFEFALLVTPVKPLDPRRHFTERYYHNPAAPGPTPEAVKAGVNVINVHHANEINPYINYPFVATAKMKDFVDRWHRRGMKVKIYYTVRELTDYVTEMFALRSLGTEVLAGGGGGGYPWLREHLGGDYTPQWYTPYDDGTADAAILTSGESRWYNYYVEGLGWLVKNVGIDGLYLDDVTYDRRILKRMRKVMERVKPGCMIDLHSNTGFSIGPATQYAEFFPYVDRIWFGESFNYEAMPPEQWLVEVSGIPFGLMGDMLQGGGNRWRGMIYGMTVRLPWESESNRADPRPVWKLWDSFGIAYARMIGYWEVGCPVRTDQLQVPATVYVRKGKTLISLASWAPSTVSVRLTVDWKALGLDPRKVRLSAPEIEDFQPARAFRLDEAIPVEPGRGWLLIAEEKSR